MDDDNDNDNDSGDNDDDHDIDDNDDNHDHALQVCVCNLFWIGWRLQPFLDRFGVTIFSG